MRAATAIVGVVLVGLIVACGGGPRSGQPASTMPEVVIGEKLQASGVIFGPWREGVLTCTTTISLPREARKPLGKNRITVKCIGRGGVKLKDGWSSYPAIAPGESAQLDLHFVESMSDITRIVLDLD